MQIETKNPPPNLQRLIKRLSLNFSEVTFTKVTLRQMSGTFTGRLCSVCKRTELFAFIVELRRYVPKAENIISDKQSGKDFERSYRLLKERVRKGDELYVKSIYRLGRDKDAINIV